MPLRIITIIVLFSVVVSALSAQGKKTYTLDRRENMPTMVWLEDAGFIKSTTQRVFRFDATGKLVWEYKLKKPSTEFPKSVVSSLDGNIVYLIPDTDGFFKQRKDNVEKVNADGTSKIFEFDPTAFDVYQPIAFFCDSKALYYLVIDKRKNPKREVVVLHRFDGNDFKHTTTDIAAPEKEETLWEYIGQKDDIHYIANKDIEFGRADNTITIVGFDGNGKVVSTTSIPYSLESKFIRPAFVVEEPLNPWVPTVYNDVIAVGSRPVSRRMFGPLMGSVNGSTPSPTTQALTQVAMDSRRGYIYLYSLLGPQPATKTGIHNMYEGFFVYRYDLSGNVLWKCQYNGNDALKNDAAFRVNMVSTDRNINFNQFYDGEVRFRIQYRKTEFDFGITNDGHVGAIRKIEALSLFDRNLVKTKGTPGVVNEDRSGKDAHVVSDYGLYENSKGTIYVYDSPSEFVIEFTAR